MSSPLAPDGGEEYQRSFAFVQWAREAGASLFARRTSEEARACSQKKVHPGVCSLKQKVGSTRPAAELAGRAL